MRFSFARQGIGFVEVLVVVGLLGLALLGIGGLAAQGTRLMAASADRHEAVLYVREAVEAVKGIRNESWSTHITPLSFDTSYYLVEQSGRWRLTNVDPGPLYGRPQNFTRTIVFSRVFRDGSGNIAASGTEDSETRRVTVTVSWTTRGRAFSIVTVTYIANLKQN